MPNLQSTWGMDHIANVQTPTCFSRGVLSISEIDGLKLIFFTALFSSSNRFVCNSTIYKFKELMFNGRRYGSLRSRSSSSSIVMASWYPNVFGLDGNYDSRPAQINYFAKHVATIQTTPITHILFSSSG